MSMKAKMNVIAERCPHKNSRSIGRWIADGFGTERVRIAVVGAKQAGKTVLLTALQNHLRWLTTACVDDEDREAKTLVGGWHVREVRRVEPKGWKEFNYASNRQKLSMDGCWPEETGMCRCMELDVCLTNEKARREIRLQALDIPGERFSDLGSMSHSNYESWCENVRARHHDDTTVSVQWEAYEKRANDAVEKAGKEFAEAAGNKDLRKDVQAMCVKSLIEEYKKFVSEQVKAHSPFVTPSAFILPNNEKREDGVEQKAIPGELCACGLVPVTKEMLTSKNGLTRAVVKEFKRRYEEYKADFKIKEIADWLETVNQVYYLVDVLETLHNGPCAYNGLDHQIGMIMKVFNPDSVGRIRGLWDFVFQTKPQKFCAVATQVDRVLGKSRDRKNIAKLLYNLFAQSWDGMKCEKKCMLCAAVKSTWERPGELLRGDFKIMRSLGKDEKVCDPKRGESPVLNFVSSDYVPMPVPESWKWNSEEGVGEYVWRYPEPKRFPRLERDKPESIGLKEIVEEMVLPKEVLVKKNGGV